MTTQTVPYREAAADINSLILEVLRENMVLPETGEKQAAVKPNWDDIKSRKFSDATLDDVAAVIERGMHGAEKAPRESAYDVAASLCGCPSDKISRVIHSINNVQGRIALYFVTCASNGQLQYDAQALGWKLTQQEDVTRRVLGRSESPMQRIAIGPNEYLQVPYSPVVVLRPISGDGCVAMLHITPTDDGYAINVYHNRADARGARVIDQFLRLLDEHNIYRGKTITPSFEFKDTGDASWEKLFMNPGMRDEILNGISAIFELEDILVANGVEEKSGIIFSGPPGTGKTEFIRCLCNYFKGKITFIWVTPADVNWSRAIRHIFEIARDLAPAIPIFEDADIYLAERGSGRSDDATGEMMQCMDGLIPLRRVVTILTSNQPHVLERALGDRPGRFNATYEFREQNDDARAAFINSLFANTGLSQEDLDWLTKNTKGMTPAKIKHKLYNFAVIFAAKRGDYDRKTKRVNLTRRTIEDAVRFASTAVQVASGDATPTGSNPTAASTSPPAPGLMRMPVPAQAVSESSFFDRQVSDGEVVL